MALNSTVLDSLINAAATKAGISSDGLAGNPAFHKFVEEIVNATRATMSPTASVASAPRKNVFSAFAGAMSKTGGDEVRAAIDAACGSVSLSLDGASPKFKDILDANTDLIATYDSVSEAYTALIGAGAVGFCAAGGVWRALGKDGQAKAISIIHGNAPASTLSIPVGSGSSTATSSAGKKTGHNFITTALSVNKEYDSLASWFADNDLKAFTGGARLWSMLNDDLHNMWHTLAASFGPLPKNPAEKRALIESRNTEVIELIDASLDHVTAAKAE